MAEPIAALFTDGQHRPREAPLAEIQEALRHLDRLLEGAIRQAENLYGAGAAADPYRGLHTSLEEVEQLLSRIPGEPTLWHGEHNGETERDPSDGITPLAWLAHTFDLSPFDVDVILVALAPEFDLRYERLCAYLQDDVTRKWPSVDLVLNLLCPSLEAKFTRRGHFAPDAPLLRHGLLHLITDPHQLQPPLLGHYLKLDEQVVRWLLGQKGLDARLAPFCQWLEPAGSLCELPLSREIQQALPALVRQAHETHQPLRLYFCGQRGVGKRRTAMALAGDLRAPLLVADLEGALGGEVEYERLLRLLFHEACFGAAIVYLDGLDALRAPDRTPQFQRVLDALTEYDGVVIGAGTQPWVASGQDCLDVIPVPFSLPEFPLRRACWQTELKAAGMALTSNALDTLASRFRLTPRQIAQAVRAAHNCARWQTAVQSPVDLRPSVQPTLDGLYAAARAQSGQELARLARQLEPRYTWDDMVLPPDQCAQLHEICQQVTYRHIVFGAWGFEHKLSLGKGLNVLFSGPPGTGKTMAAEVMAKALQLDLYKIDLSQVVSKYIGDTEKNLDRIFTAAESANAILFFDEADALFGKRSEVKDAHDRYANIEVSYLLQKMEEYEGIAILATNLRQHLDEAFVRRMQVIVEFPFPDEEYRRRIGEVVFPRAAPLGDDVDFGSLARAVKLAGGNIKNIAVAAAFYAAEEGGRIHMPHLMRAARREHQKLGRAWNGEEWSTKGVSVS